MNPRFFAWHPTLVTSPCRGVLSSLTADSTFPRHDARRGPAALVETSLKTYELCVFCDTLSVVAFEHGRSRVLLAALTLSEVETQYSASQRVKSRYYRGVRKRSPIGWVSAFFEEVVVATGQIEQASLLFKVLSSASTTD